MNKNFHSYPLDNIFLLLKSNPQGLSSQKALSRLQKHGPNVLPIEKKFSILTLFIRQFQNPLIYILFAAFFISLFTKHYVDAWIVMAVILASAIVGFIQEYKASQALNQLKKLVRYKARVIRDGEEKIINQEDVVIGDIILLSPGDKIPADARLVKSDNLQVIEAALTGESEASNKFVAELPPETTLAERENMVYLGTVVAKGKATAVITSTGSKTEIGLVASMVRETKEQKTPLQKKINSFGKTIGLALIVINIVIFLIGILTGRPVFEMFLTTVAIVVAAIPEGLLPAMTIILAVGMQKLAKHKGLVRKMLAAETLGSVSVICSDKTGTLTQGEMRVTQVLTEDTTFFNQDSKNKQLLDNNQVYLALKIGLLCNNAIAENPQDKQNLQINGDPTEKALWLAGHDNGLSKSDLEKKEPRLAEIPFDSENKLMATLHTYQQNQKSTVTYVKGAPEKLLNLCSYLETKNKKIKLTDTKKAKLQTEYEKLTREGLRVLAIAYKINPSKSASQKFSLTDLNDLVFVALIGIKDPLRPETKQAIRQCIEAGIRPIIVTGDHKLTAAAIVSELGITADEKYIFEGTQIDSLTDEELEQKVKEVVIFARVEPKHKIRIVKALQNNGEVVAMTGDGVNDAPALKSADIGVAVGSGTDVAKEVADLVLLDNNFQTIVQAIERGRTTFNNIRKVILFLTTDSFTEIVLIGGAVILGFPLPILPVQILWIKLAEGAAPAMALAFDETNEDVMKDKPRKKEEPIVNSPMRKLILIYALIMDFGLFALFYGFWKVTNDFELARTITFVGLGLSSFFYVFTVRGLKTSVLKINPFSNKPLLISVGLGMSMLLAAVYLPFLNRVLQTVPLNSNEWLILLIYASISIIVYEIGKKLTLSKS